MNYSSLNDVVYDAHQKMATYNLFDYGWKFELDHAKKRLGCCKFHDKTISLSKYYIEMNLGRGNDILDTILHEIAHALDYIRNGWSSHGRNWQRICIEIGANPRRCKKDLEMPKGKFSYICPNCGEITYYHKKIRREHAFGRYDARFKLMPCESNPY